MCIALPTLPQRSHAIKSVSAIDGAISSTERGRDGGHALRHVSTMSIVLVPGKSGNRACVT
jgi:hypothetical protein